MSTGADSRMSWYHDIRSRRGGRPRGSLTAAAVGLAAAPRRRGRPCRSGLQHLRVRVLQGELSSALPYALLQRPHPDLVRSAGTAVAAAGCGGVGGARLAGGAENILYLVPVVFGRTDSRRIVCRCGSPAAGIGLIGDLF